MIVLGTTVQPSDLVTSRVGTTSPGAGSKSATPQFNLQTSSATLCVSSGTQKGKLIAENTLQLVKAQADAKKWNGVDVYPKDVATNFKNALTTTIALGNIEGTATACTMVDPQCGVSSATSVTLNKKLDDAKKKYLSFVSQGKLKDALSLLPTVRSNAKTAMSVTVRLRRCADIAKLAADAATAAAIEEAANAAAIDTIVASDTTATLPQEIIDVPVTLVPPANESFLERHKKTFLYGLAAVGAAVVVIKLAR